jgi:septum formation protein
MQKTANNDLIILASKSPRREYLLKQAGLTFSVIPSQFQEDAIPMSNPGNYARVQAEAKAEAVSHLYPESWVIGADTIVVIDEVILGKPDTRKDAREMLYRLSGKVHEVLTGYSICCQEKQIHFSETVATEVLFKPLVHGEIEWYIHTNEPFDKAGGYAIQGLGSVLVKKINGSYSNVVGLPVCEVMEFLMEQKVVDVNRLSS